MERGQSCTVIQMIDWLVRLSLLHRAHRKKIMTETIILLKLYDVRCHEERQVIDLAEKCVRFLHIILVIPY